MRRLPLSLVPLLLMTLACPRPHAPTTGGSPSSPGPFHPAADEKWLTLFDAYPGARELCSQSVVGNGMNIDWTAYATPDEPRLVMSFYARVFPDAKVSDGHMVVDGGEDRLLDVQPVAGSYPHCGTDPAPGDRTVPGRYPLASPCAPSPVGVPSGDAGDAGSLAPRSFRRTPMAPLVAARCARRSIKRFRAPATSVATLSSSRRISPGRMPPC